MLRRRSSPKPKPKHADVLPLSKQRLLDDALTACTLAILALVLLRCLVPVSPNLYWDSDPRISLSARVSQSSDQNADADGDAAIEIQSSPGKLKEVAAIGPAALAWLDVLMLFACAAAWALMAMLADRKSKRFQNGVLIVLVMIGCVFCLLHMVEHVGNLRQCGSWLAAAIVGITMMHLCQRQSQRRWVVAGLLALTLPLLIESLQYVFVDHAATLKYFRKNESEFLQSRGWEEGSPQHLLYVRRIEFDDVFGAIGFSNILGSLAGALCLIAGVVTYGAIRNAIKSSGQVGKVVSRLIKPVIIVPFIACLAAGLNVWLTHSKGALVALGVVAVFVASIVIVAARVNRRTDGDESDSGCSKDSGVDSGEDSSADKHGGITIARVLKKLIGPAALTLVAIAIAAVLIRGAAGPPETDEGERSLLFRFHYWQAAAEIAGTDAQSILGTGPAEFRSQYSAAKNPVNPEEVHSAHNVFVDFIVTLGIGGWAWTFALLSMLWIAGRQAVDLLCSTFATSPTGDDEPTSGSAASRESTEQQSQRDLKWALVFTLIVFLGQLVVRATSLGTPARLIVWASGMIGFLAVVAMTVQPVWQRRAWQQLALFAAALVVLVHNQIEMSFFQAASAPIMWLIVGVAASSCLKGQSEKEQQQSAGMNEAANTPTSARPWWFKCLPAGIVGSLALLMAILSAIPLSNQQSHLQRAAQLYVIDSHTRAGVMATIVELQLAEQALPIDPMPYRWQIDIALNEVMRLAQYRDHQRAGPVARSDLADEQMVMLDREIEHWLGGATQSVARAKEAGVLNHALLTRLAIAQEHAARLLNRPEQYLAAIATREQLVERQPYAWRVRIDLADLLWSQRRIDEAKSHYARAIELSEMQYLDPAKQMAPNALEHANKRMAGHGLNPETEK